MKRTCLVVVTLGLVGFGAAPAMAASPMLPDLGMARLQGFTIDTTTMPGHKLLRFGATIVNLGAGPFEVHGSRPDTTSTMGVSQRIFYDDGTYVDSPTSATMDFAIDGHDHWHVEHLELYRLMTANGSKAIKNGAKVGFCFRDSVAHDLSLPGAPQNAVYTYDITCSRDQPDALTVFEGISVGWGDRYPRTVAYQWIDVTHVADGTYRVKAIADPRHLFTEASTTNNTTWTTIKIAGDTVTVVRQGPAS